MRRLLNQAANAAVKYKGSIFEILDRQSLGHNQTIGVIALSCLPRSERMHEQIVASPGRDYVTIDPTTGLFSSQEGLLGTDENCSGTTVGSNPLDVTTSTGNMITRRRAIGTGNVVNAVRDVTDAIGYAFWSFSNVGNCLGNCKYLTVDGVDPIKNSYSDGTLPDLAHASDVTFANIGSYPIWSVLRVVTDSPTPSSISTLISDAQSYTSTRPDFIPASGFTYVRSHFVREGMGPADNGSDGACDPAGNESGGDVGGVVYTIAADQAYCTLTGITTGQIGNRE